MRTQNKIAIGILAVVLVVVSLVFLNSKKEGITTRQVVVAINMPLTGPIAGWGGQFPNGFRMGIEDACQAHGIPTNTFVIDAQDNAGKPEQAVSILRRQEVTGFDVYISGPSGPVNALAPLLDAGGKPHFCASFIPFITKASPTRFRIMANSGIEAPLFVDYAKAHNAKHVHVIYLNYPNLEEQYTALLEPQLKALGTIVTRERYEMDVNDFKTIAQKAKDQSADLLFVMGFSFHLQAMLKDLRAAGLVSKGKVVANMDFVDLVHAGTSLEELRDVYFMSPYFDVSGKVPKADGWRQRYEAKFGMKATYVPAYAYDNATAVVLAYAKTKNVNPASLLTVFPFEGVNGEIALNTNRDIVATVALAEINSEGRIVEVKP